MKIIAWNCNMAFRKKAAVIMAHEPDILVISECEHPDNLIFPEGVSKPTSVLWFGDNRHKGLGVFSYNGFTMKLRRNYNPAYKLIAPIAVTHPDIQFTLYAIWAHNPDDPDGQYVEQIWKAIHHYDRQLKKPAVLAGDFNSNTIWDRKYRVGNHSHVVERLEKRKIYSTYHLFHEQAQGKELHPTWYMYRHKDKPYHLDYCFASEHFTTRLQAVEIGDYDDWKQYSDHVPVIVTFK